MADQIFHDSDADRAFRAKRFSGRLVIYGILILWAIIALFPIYWTITTSFKIAPDVMKGNILPYWDYTPKWLGWRSLGLSPDTIGNESTVREEFLKRFWNSAVIAVSASVIAVGLGSCAAYGLSRFNYKFGFMRNADISFFFLSQLILPPVVLALPFLVLYKALGMLDTRIGLILLYALTVLSLVLTWNEYFFAALLTSSHAKTLPVMVASQTGSQGISWWSMAALSFAAILPLIIIGIALERYIIKGMAAGAVK